MCYDLRLKVNYITPEGEKVTVRANPGDNLLDIAHAYDIDLEGSFFWSYFSIQNVKMSCVLQNIGACEGSLACSTCEVFMQDNFRRLFDVI
jgi:ferredoxin